MLNKISITCLFVILVGMFLQYNNTAYSQLKNSKISNLKVELNKADFTESSFDKLFVESNGVDFSNGTATFVGIHSFGFRKDDIIIDEINVTLKNISFVTDSLISNQELLLNNPVEASGNIVVTEKAINSILNQPKILENFSNMTETKISKFGIQLNAGMISFYQPKASILPNNRLQIEMMASVANLLAFPVKFSCTIALQNSRLTMSSPELITSGVTLPSDISQIINDKLNQLLDMNAKIGDEMNVQITSLEMVPRQKIIVSGTATIKKLNFGKKVKNNN